ncbi:MAG: YheT family hydrolase [Thermodesulfobacteriota bacterium]
MTHTEYVNGYKPPLLFRNGHIQSIYPVLFRKIDSSFYERERIDTPDGDFLDLDWSVTGCDRLAVISHGLEGNSHRAYVTGMAKTLNSAGWDVLAWNYRSCSGEPNRLLKSYHNGSTEDLSLVIQHAEKQKRYREIALVGFSLGGNLSLMHLGRDSADPIVTKAVVFSVPCDLKSSVETISKPSNTIYMKRFLKMLHEKIRAKMEIMPGLIDDKGFEKIKTFREFDDRYTAPIHGFRDALDYWEKCSSKQFLSNIKVPVLIVNAADDPFLPGECYPDREASENPNITLEVPESGGHVGFIEFNRENRYWSEKRAVSFLNSCMEK